MRFNFDLEVFKRTIASTQIGTLPDGESNPELTGSGAGELFGYYPGRFNTK